MSNDLLSRTEGGTVMTEIKKEVTSNKVFLYMKGTPDRPRCGFSRSVVMILESLDVSYEACDILADPEKRQAIKTYTQWPTIPQLYVDGEFVGGSDIVMEMHQAGELKAVVTAAKS